LPEREGQPFFDNIEHGVKGPILGAQEPWCAQQEEIAGRVGQVHGTSPRAVLADDEPPAARQDKDGDEVDRPGAVPMRREAERAGRVAVQGGVGKAQRAGERRAWQSGQLLLQKRLKGFSELAKHAVQREFGHRRIVLLHAIGSNDGGLVGKR
jgi:hypothetical protein